MSDENMFRLLRICLAVSVACNLLGLALHFGLIK